MRCNNETLRAVHQQKEGLEFEPTDRWFNDNDWRYCSLALSHRNNIWYLTHTIELCWSFVNTSQENDSESYIAYRTAVIKTKYISNFELTRSTTFHCKNGRLKHINMFIYEKRAVKVYSIFTPVCSSNAWGTTGIAKGVNFLENTI